MENDAIQEWRRKRLAELSARFGGSTALGQALGYSSGAFIGQMRTGHREITEKFVLKAEALPGCEGWFDGKVNSRPAPKVITTNHDDALEAALLSFARVVSKADKYTRSSVAGALSGMLDQPAEAENFARHIALLLRTSLVGQQAAPKPDEPLTTVTNNRPGGIDATEIEGETNGERSADDGETRQAGSDRRAGKTARAR